jgi:hypothetical protein
MIVFSSFFFKESGPRVLHNGLDDPTDRLHNHFVTGGFQTDFNTFSKAQDCEIFFFIIILFIQNACRQDFTFYAFF